MALSFSVNPPQVAGTKRVVRGTVTFDSSYPTGGEAFTAANVGLMAIEHVEVQPGAGYVVRWDRSTSAPKLVAYMGDNDNASDGPLIQVADTTDLSSIVCGIQVTGY